MMYGEKGKYAMFKQLWSMILHCLIFFVHALYSGVGVSHPENMQKDGMNVWIYTTE